MNWATAGVLAAPILVSAFALAVAWLNARVRFDGCRDCGVVFSQPGTADPPATHCPACVALYAQAVAAGQTRAWVPPKGPTNAG